MAEKRKVTVRSDEQLAQGGAKDKLILAFRYAARLAKRNDYAGVPKLMEAKNKGGVLYRVAGKKGSIMKLDEGSDQFKKLKSLANSAMDDIADLKYTDKVKAFLNETISVSAPRAAGGINTQIIKGLRI